jgi:hypothetical protein
MNKIILLSVITFIFFSFSSIAKNKNEEIQRIPTSTFDLQNNSISNFQFPATNYGILFLNVPQNRGGGYWPRESLNQYIFGGGMWFAAQKFILCDSLVTDDLGNVIDTAQYRAKQMRCEVSYNPNSGVSWMVPGRIEESDTLENDKYKYRVYFSTDMDSEGNPIDPTDGPSWPLWKSDQPDLKKLGNYIYAIDERTPSHYPLGPAFISDEDIFCTYKDTDLNFLEGGTAYREALGYPLGLQYEQTILSWSDEDKKDMIIILYKIINTSLDTLYDCWFGHIDDVDVARSPNVTAGAGNDKFRYYNEDSTLNLAIGWTRDDPMEAGFGFGYIGLSLPFTPATDENHYLISNFQPEFNPGNGLVTFKNWHIAEDILEDASRYYVLSSGLKSIDIEAGDYRTILSTGPFTMLPNDTALIAFQINFALPSLGGEATGETEDLVDLVNKVKLGQRFFYDEILADVSENSGNNNETLKVFPNPASDKIFIKHSLQEKVNIKIYDMLGQIVYQGITNNSRIIEIDATDFPTGNYIICLNNNNNVISGKICVIR